MCLLPLAQEQEKREAQLGKPADDTPAPELKGGSAAPQASPEPKARAASAEPGKATTPAQPTLRATTAEPQATPFHGMGQQGNGAVPHKNGKVQEAHALDLNRCASAAGSGANAVDRSVSPAQPARGAPCAAGVGDPNPDRVSLSPSAAVQCVPCTMSGHAPAPSHGVPAVVLTETDRQNVPSRICLHKTLGAKPFKSGQGTVTAVLNGAAKLPSAADVPATAPVDGGLYENPKDRLPQESSGVLGLAPSAASLGDSHDASTLAGDGEGPGHCARMPPASMCSLPEAGSDGAPGDGPQLAHREGLMTGGAETGWEDGAAPDAVAQAGPAPGAAVQRCAVMVTQDDIARAAALKVGCPAA
jgi:hypothetical protein